MLAAVRAVVIVLFVCGMRAALAATLVAGSGDTAAGGHNTTVPYTFAIGPYNQFNPALGGLRDIDFALQANMFGQIHVMTSVSGTYALDLTAHYVVDYPGTTTTLISDSSAFEHDPADAVPAGGAIIVLSGSATPSYGTGPLDTLTKFGVLSQFIGTGTYTLPVNADKIASVMPAPNDGYTSSAAERAVITVTYTYGAASSTAATSLVAIYSANAQNGALRATVMSGNTSLSGGLVTFMLMDGAAQVGSTVQAAPNAGAASAAFTLPAAQHLGTYTVIATYDGGSSYGLSQGSAPFYIRSDEIFSDRFGS
jgi:hypothetical protein